MNSLLTIGASAVRAYQGALATVSSNIANAGVEGYSRRDAALVTGPLTGQAWPLLHSKSSGSGVFMDGVHRAYDRFLTADARTAGTQAAQFALSETWQTRLQNAVGPNDNNVGTSLTAFFNAAQEVAAAPDSTAARTQFLGQADQLAAQFRRTAISIDDVSVGIKEDLAATAVQANGLLKGLFDVNQSIRRASPGSDLQAGLKDQRDVLLGKMSKIAGINVTEKNTGTVDIRLGSKHGPLLLDLSEASSLSFEAVGGDTGIFVIRNGVRVETASATNGEIAGLASSLRQAHAAQAKLDSLAENFTASINLQHKAGTDLRGNAGQALYAMTGLDVANAANNRGTVVAEARLGISAVPAASYTARYNSASAQWTLNRSDNSATITGTSPLQLDGMTLTLGGSPRDGDQVVIVAGFSARHMQVLTADPAQVAAAAPWQANAALANTGMAQATVSADSSNAFPLAAGYRFTVSAPGMADVFDATTNMLLTTVGYTDTQPIAGTGFSLTLSGTANTGDSFTVRPTRAASRNNDNMQDIIRLRAPEAQGFEQKFQAQRTGVSQDLQDIRLRRSAADIIKTESERARDGRSAVNLDEEAADLVRFQQAYQASARILTVAQDIFESILQAT
jgi:flagellar hook-associated protein 1